MALNYSSISSLASIVNMFAGSDPVKAQLIPLDNNGREVSEQQRAFQYFPNEISDSKSANYATKNIPGGSHPLYQFINGGDRTISFSAIFTSDEDPAPPGILGALQGGLELGLGSITNLLGGNNPLNSSGTTVHNAPVDSGVIWLRSFLYPRYQGSVASPPPVVRLYLPNSGIHGTTDGKSPQLVLDSVDCIMTQCDVTYDSFYRNGKQRISTVSLSFNETVQTGKANWGFADGRAFTNAWQGGTQYRGGQIGPYGVRGKDRQPDTGTTQNAIASAINSYSGGVLS